MIRAIALMLLLPGLAYSNALQQLDVYKSTAVYRVSGKIGVAASSSTYSTFTITLDGVNGISTTKQIITTSSITATNITAMQSQINNASVLTATQTFTGLNTFGPDTSTTTFSGWVDIGLVVISSSCASSSDPCVASCSTGLRVLGGGCFGGGTNNAITRTYPSVTNVWNCNNESATAKIAFAICARVK